MRLTINDMKNKSTDFFFSPKTMTFFRGYKYRSVYDKDSDRNFIKVLTNRGTTIYYEFYKNGKVSSCKDSIEDFLNRRNNND